MEKMKVAKQYYAMSVRLRNIAAEFEDEVRREVKDNYERSVRERLARHKEAASRNAMGWERDSTPMPILRETTQCFS